MVHTFGQHRSHIRSISRAPYFSDSKCGCVAHSVIMAHTFDQDRSHIRSISRAPYFSDRECGCVAHSVNMAHTFGQYGAHFRSILLTRSVDIAPYDARGCRTTCGGATARG
eukprot:7955929-Pyramimonas_sp.AAC.1